MLASTLCSHLPQTQAEDDDGAPAICSRRRQQFSNWGEWRAQMAPTNAHIDAGNRQTLPASNAAKKRCFRGRKRARLPDCPDWKGRDESLAGNTDSARIEVMQVVQL